MTEKQNEVLTEARKNNDKVEIYLISGNQLEGELKVLIISW
jgi:sRNA-binding regulator protein Hfq